MKSETTHFGFETVTTEEKVKRVADVFHSVARRYDVMNDLMSLGVHRLWKRAAMHLLGLHRDHIVLDVAGGTGDLSQKIVERLGQSGQLLLCDINSSMLTVARDRFLDRGFINHMNIVQADAEQLPFQENSFDRIIMGFGLRNVTRKELALQSIFRILKPGGRAIILEFSKPVLPGLQSVYDAYSLTVLPWLGKTVLNDADSYRYLAESIRMHPDQHALKNMMQDAGFEDSDYYNLSGGIVAIHRGHKY